MNYEKTSQWATLIFVGACGINIVADWIRKTRNLGVFFYVGMLAAALALWSMSRRIVSAQEAQAAAEATAAAAAAKPDFPTVEIDEKPGNIESEIPA